jgi:hypothetical protein
MSPFKDSKEYPLTVRQSGENHDATTPVTRTRENHESVLVAFADNCALRITVGGYRVLARSPDGLWRSYNFNDRRWFDIATKAATLQLLRDLAGEGIFAPAAVEAVANQVQGWPETAQTAWRQLHADKSIPAFASHITPAHKYYMLGV